MARTTIQNFDQLNNLRSLPIEQYFGEMRLPKRDIAFRIGFAEVLYTAFQDLLYMLGILLADEVENGFVGVDKAYVKSAIEPKIRQAIESKMPIDKKVDLYIPVMIGWIIDTTVKNSKDPWYFSDDRARYIAENEVNGLSNYEDYQEAILAGKTKKTWLSMKDEKVRLTHTIVDGTTVGIDDYFIVGGYPALYPHDLNLPPQETVNCRCSVKYS